LLLIKNILGHFFIKYPKFLKMNDLLGLFSEHWSMQETIFLQPT